MNVKISVVTVTKRRGLDPVRWTLERQTFKDFEWIIVDDLFEIRREKIRGWLSDFPFLWKHLPTKARTQVPSVWETRDSVDYYFNNTQRKWTPMTGKVASSYNTAIIHMNGSLMVVLHDFTLSQQNNYLERFWDAYESFPHRQFCGVNRIASPQFGAQINESKNLGEIYGFAPGTDFMRVNPTEQRGLCWGLQRNLNYDEWVESLIAPTETCSAYPLEGMLEVNGWDELWDRWSGGLEGNMVWRLNIAGWKMMHNDAVHAVSIWHRDLESHFHPHEHVNPAYNEPFDLLPHDKPANPWFNLWEMRVKK